MHFRVGYVVGLHMFSILTTNTRKQIHMLIVCRLYGLVFITRYLDSNNIRRKTLLVSKSQFVLTHLNKTS